MKVGAKRSWSQATRARISAFLLGRTTRFERILNQVVAAGPKTAGGFGFGLLVVGFGLGVRSKGKKRGDVIGL